MGDSPPPTWVSWQDYVDGEVHWLSREIDSRVVGLAARLDERFQAQQHAVTAYADSNQRALERLNELRQAFNDQTSRFVTHDAQRVVDVKIISISERVGMLENNAANLAGKAEQAVSSARMMIAIVSTILLVVQVALHLLWR